MAQLPLGYNVPMTYNANGMAMPAPGIPPMPVPNEVKFAPNASNMPTGVNPALALAFGAQNAGAGVNAQGQPVGGGGAAGVAPSMQAVTNAQTAQATNAQTGQPTYFDPTWYVQNNPDVLKGFNSQKDKGEGIDWYGKFHYDNFGKTQGGRFLGPNDPAYLARQSAGLGGSTSPAPSATQLAAYQAMSPEDQMNLVNFLKGMGLA